MLLESLLDGLELIKWTNTYHVAVIILDIWMPNKRGIEVLISAIN